MQSTTIIKQILDFNKKAFDDSFKAVIAVQEQTEKMMFALWGKSPYLPEEGKKVVGDWIATCKKGADDFKQTVDSRFKEVEDYLLKATGQLELSLNKAARQNPIVAITDVVVAKKVAVDEEKDVVAAPAVKKETSRKKTDKQK